MPQLQNLVLTDRESTPVNHTFVPRDITDGVGVVAESSGVPIGDNRVSVKLHRTVEGRHKVTIKGVFPIVQDQTINGITEPTVVRTAYAEATFSFDAKSTEQERNNVVGMFQSAFDANEALINDTVVKLQGVY